MSRLILMSWMLGSLPAPETVKEICTAKHAHAYILPYTQVTDRESLTKFWNDHVVIKGYEGIVVRDCLNTYKIKTISDIDVVIIGLKKTKSFRQGRVASVRVVLMDAKGSFIIAQLPECHSPVVPCLRVIRIKPYGLVFLRPK